MTRPEIIRADTLDLQDKTSPTAADHSTSAHPAPLGVGPAAPHQQATLQHVEHERNTNEKGIWDTNDLHDEPGSDEEPTGDEDNSARLLNGGIGSDGNDAEVGDGEDDDYDDMDRISSSPSISDEGRYSLPSHFHTSRQPASPSTESSPVTSSSPTCCSSSPFTDAPIYFPLSVAAARRPLRVPAGGTEATFLTQSFPLLRKTNSEDHHHGEYWTRTTKGPMDDAMAGSDNIVSPRAQRFLELETQLQGMHLDSQLSLFSDADEGPLQAISPPAFSPAKDHLEDPFTDSTERSSTVTIGTQEEADTSEQTTVSPPGSLSEEDSWTTDSDADSLDLQDDDTDDISFSDDPRFVDSGFGGECLQELADIDFQSVYALHTFVATVEGQANATKGDTMVLLDDSNSYWWLVRVVKDSSIGYLPAEHIETPTERLARLNKHRNIDLSATMLGDTAEKTKNPLKKAMRRRNAKTVQFGPPEYVEASDYDYSSDEGGEEELFGGVDPNQAQAQQTEQQAATVKAVEPEQDDGMKVQPLKVNGAKKETATDPDAESNETGEELVKNDSRSSNEIVDQPMDPKVSRNGTMRNTDSFFKDDNTETRKITLTPNLLRDDSSTSTTGSRERGPSLESLEKTGFADKVKEKEKKKEKKPGMLSGLFKRKDKKTKGATESFDSDTEKHSDDLGRSSPQSKPSDVLTSAERPSMEQVAPQRQVSKGKLQKPQRANSDAPVRTKSILKTDSPEPLAVQTALTKEHSEKSAAQPSSSTMRLVAPESEDAIEPAAETKLAPPESNTRSNSGASKLNPLNMIKTQQNAEPKPEKVKKAKQRIQLDDFDSDEEDQKDPFSDPDVRMEPSQPSDPEPTGRLSESPVHVSAADAQPPEKESVQEKDLELDSQQPPGLTGDTSSQETSSPISTPTPDDNPSTSQPNKTSLSTSQPTTSPSPTRLAPPTTLPLTIPPPSRPAPIPQKDMDMSPPNSSESTNLPAWSDSSLRTYLDDGSDIRDMLVVINDTTGVVPVGQDHPIMAQFCIEERKTMSGLSSELDSLLNGLLEKRMNRSKSASPTMVKAGK